MFPGWSTIGMSVLITLMMFRLSLVSGLKNCPSASADRTAGVFESRRRVLLFGLVILVTMAGYFTQPIIECIALSRCENAVAKNWLTFVITALAPGAIAAYFTISAVGSRGSFRSGSAALVIALTAVDFWQAIQGTVPYREFLFSFLCNVIGAPIGIAIALLAQSRLWQREPAA